MAPEGEQRRLAAILAADMVGYSRLMEADEAGTLARQRSSVGEVLQPEVERHGGRLVKTTGDGMLVEFPSVLEAVECALAIQASMAEREVDIADAERIQYRIGINLGDIIIDGEDIFGEGVNVAARLETLCEPGGVCVSDVVHQIVQGKLDAPFDDLGPQRVKNISRRVHAWQWRAGLEPPRASGARSQFDEQEIRFCTAPDGVRIAYAVVGSGPPLIKAPNWLGHLEYDWKMPIWRHLFEELAATHTLVRFDQRANGLSDWDPAEVSFDAMLSDLETVVDAVGVDRFPMLGISQGCAYSIAYAVRHPERVTRLVLYGGFAKGWLKSGSERLVQQANMQREMILRGWGQNNPAFRQFFTSLFMPGATKEQMDWFNELQLMTASPENAARLRDVSTNIDVSDLLGSVSVPTLVMHARGDGMVPFESGRSLAAGIPGARFVALEGQNHLILEGEPAWPRFIAELTAFLALDEQPDGDPER